MNHSTTNNQAVLKEKAASAVVYTKTIPGFGKLDIRPLDIEQDISVIHDWVTREYAHYWGLLHATEAEVKEEYINIVHSDGCNAYIGLYNNKPAFLCECYDPAVDPVGEHYEVRPGDRGMHILTAPADTPVHNFTWYVFTTVMDFIFSDGNTDRIVVEPDVNNDKIHQLNKKAGFRYQKNIALPEKTAALAFCTRDQYEEALINDSATSGKQKQAVDKSPEAVVAHLKPAVWNKANRRLLAKAIAEFAHELLIHPELEHSHGKKGHYRLMSSEIAGIEYRFDAIKLSLDHWHVHPESIQKTENGAAAPVDVIDFIKEFQGLLGIDASRLPGYLEELINTLYSNAYMLAGGKPTSQELVDSDYQTIEHAMSGGHPCFVANSGRIGFDANDYFTYAPEADHPIRLLWVAGHKSRASYNGTSDLPYYNLLNKELDSATLNTFNAKLQEQGLNPEDYYFIPLHPWQWYNKLATVFAPDIAAGNLVVLGYGPDEFSAQQSIRTFYNLSHPEKFYTKTALSILNMGFIRGLSPYYMEGTPLLTEWIKSLTRDDEWLHKTGFTLLCEVATVGYRNLHFESFGKDCPYNKMLAALWRESPAPVISANQRLITMAALLHVDENGTAFLNEIIRSSGLSTSAWVEHYLRAYLSPLLHFFYEYDTVFMPHGENIILVMEDDQPVKAIMKDVTEEILVFHPKNPLPKEAQRIWVEVPEHLRLLSVFTDVFDSVFRFLGGTLEIYCGYPEEAFWQQVAECIHEYQREHPELADKFEKYDIFAPEFSLSCLNRLQLKNNQQLLDLQDPVSSLQFAGTLKNPLAEYQNVSFESA